MKMKFTQEIFEVRKKHANNTHSNVFDVCQIHYKCEPKNEMENNVASSQNYEVKL